MNNPYKVIIEPLVTEKATKDSGTDQPKYHFKVDRSADKIQVRTAIEKIYGVQVSHVNLLNVRGKKKRLGRFEGFRPSWKKAIVTLAEGQSINLYGA